MSRSSDPYLQLEVDLSNSIKHDNWSAAGQNSGPQQKTLRHTVCGRLQTENKMYSTYRSNYNCIIGVYQKANESRCGGSWSDKPRQIIINNQCILLVDNSYYTEPLLTSGTLTLLCNTARVSLETWRPYFKRFQDVN